MVAVVGLNLALLLTFLQLERAASAFTCGADGFYANPSDCLKFISCSKGNRMDFDCPQGTSWHADKGLCAATDLSKCSTKAPTAGDTSEDSLQQQILDALKNFKPCNGGKGTTRPHRHRTPKPTIPPPTCPACPIPDEKICPPSPTCPPPAPQPTCPACPTAAACPASPTCPPPPPACSVPKEKVCPTVAAPCPTTTPKPPTTTCDEGWKYNDATKSCYFLGTGKQVKFMDAQRACRDMGSTLASVHSEAENTFILDYAKSAPVVSPVWIGVFRNGPNTTNFENYDGTPLDYTKWCTGEPNNAGENEFCVELLANSPAHGPDSTWNDRPCEGYLTGLYACKKPANK